MLHNIFGAVIFSLALCSSLMFLIILVCDVVNAITWSNTMHTQEEMELKDKMGPKAAKVRLAVGIITSVLWGLFYYV